MSTQPLDYSAILADLEAKKAAIEATISSLRSALSLGAIGHGGEVPSATGAPSMGLHNGEIPNGAFLGKSIPDAAKLYLEILKKKQTTREIADALQRGGMESTSSKFVSIVHATLNRSRKTANSPLVRIGNTWGLASWYPKGIISSNAPPSAKKKSKKVKKAKKADDAPSEPRALPAGKASERALAFVQSKPQAEFSLDEIAKHIGMGINGARLTLGKLVKGGKMRMSAPGTYTVAPFVTTAAAN